MSDAAKNFDLQSLTVDVVVTYVAAHTVSPVELPTLIADVHAALARAAAPPTEKPSEPPTPAISVKKSISKEYLISFEDGLRYKSLKRHLSGRGMTPQQYRAKWNLPIDYPMVAENFSARRSEIAKAMGFGRKAKAESVPKSAAGRVKKSPGRKTRG